MPRADFYLIAKPRFREQPLRLVCELVRKAYAADLWTLVLARDTAQAEELDDLLWDMGDDTYIPHQIAGRDDEDDVTPVLIVLPSEAETKASAYTNSCRVRANEKTTTVRMPGIEIGSTVRTMAPRRL